MSKRREEKESEEKARRRFTSICVLGGSNLGKDREFITTASYLGKILAARKINLVYGGGMHGLKGCVAASAFVGGSKVLGVVLKDLPNKNDTQYTFGSELRVTSLPERNGYMFNNAEAFIALPGGLETLEGISNIAFWAKLNLHRKPLGLLNINGFYDSLLSFLDHAVEHDLIPQATRSLIFSASTADQLMDQLQIYAPEPAPLMKQVDWQPTDGSKKYKPDNILRL